MRTICILCIMSSFNHLFAMESHPISQSPSGSQSPLTQRLILCAKTNSEYLRNEMDRIPSPHIRRHIQHTGHKSGPQKKFLDLSRKKQEELLENNQQSYLPSENK